MSSPAARWGLYNGVRVQGLVSSNLLQPWAVSHRPGILWSWTWPLAYVRETRVGQRQIGRPPCFRAFGYGLGSITPVIAQLIAPAMGPGAMRVPTWAGVWLRKNLPLSFLGVCGPGTHWGEAQNVCRVSPSPARPSRDLTGGRVGWGLPVQPFGVAVLYPPQDMKQVTLGPLLSGMGKEVGNLLLENSQLLETK